MHKLLVSVSAVFLLASCTSFGDKMTVAFSIPDKDRAIALVSAGTDVYKTGVVADGDLAALGEARRLFEAAIRLDPMNKDASRYLATVEDYRASKFESSFSRAQDLSKKANRTAEEDYAMHSALRRAITLYPKDDDAKKMVKDTAKARADLVKAYLDKSEAATKALPPNASTAVKERTYIEAFTLVSRAAELEPSSGDATDAYNELKSNIGDIVKRRLDNLKKMYGDHAYTDARGQLNLLKELDTKIGRPFRADLKEAEYELYFSWASYNEKKKDWNSAEARIAQAQNIKKTAEAAELAKRVVNSRTEEERGVGFTTGLKNLDALISKGDLDGAQRLITSLSRLAEESSQRKAVDDRRRTMRGAIGTVYERGVKAYKEERFKDAIAALSTVVNVEPEYEDAQDYLTKAQDKQKLLDQY